MAKIEKIEVCECNWDGEARDCFGFNSDFSGCAVLLDSDFEHRTDCPFFKTKEDYEANY